MVYNQQFQERAAANFSLAWPTLGRLVFPVVAVVSVFPIPPTIVTGLLILQPSKPTVAAAAVFTANMQGLEQ